MLTNSKEKGTVQGENKNSAEITKETYKNQNIDSCNQNQGSSDFVRFSDVAKGVLVKTVHEKFKDDMESNDCWDHVATAMIDLKIIGDKDNE